ncbi:MAG: hypothetical protein LQ340_003777 [Diploschistes diacapsis]|nr:MAG: hypothetical protein LQ340_003777 [Diploschistes diacapsis]
MISIPIRATESPFEGEKPWSVRRPKLVNELRFNAANNNEAFICCQEVLHNQLQDILADLNAGGDVWAYIGVGRDDGEQAGEYSPIFYRPAAWKLSSARTVWFSDTPDIPSQDPDAASIRILTLGFFSHVASGRHVAVFNTHLDDQSSEARLRAAKEISHRLATIGHVPTFLTGDFNSEPSQEAYQYLVSEASVLDTFNQVSPKKRYRNSNTFTGFGFENEPPKRIDFVFVMELGRDTKDPMWTVASHAVLANKFDDGVCNSDHRAVIVDLTMH